MINLNEFSISADHDGSMSVDHLADGCYGSIYLSGEEHCPTIAQAIQIAERHFKVCPLRVKQSGPLR